MHKNKWFVHKSFFLCRKISYLSSSISNLFIIFASLMIDRATVDRIMAATNIVDVVGDFVSLKKRGVNYIGLCPFHNDTHPSFSVSPSRGICHCFTCGKGGNAVNFLMELEQMTYPEALRWLARKYNIEIKEKELTAEEKQKENDRESMFIINQWTSDYFEDILHNDVDGLAVGMQYFRGRGFRDDIIQKFHLGFDPNDRHRLSRTAMDKGYKEKYLLDTGICYRNDRGELIDRYAGRVVFPWFSVSGRVVGFTARVLDSRTHGVAQKYVNSPDSEIYHKAHELYGIYQAKKAISKEKRVFLVEGQADVISMYQSGVENVVANSGTALTVQQIRLLHRFTDNIVLLYDGDAAGKQAALRGTDMLLSEGMNVKVLLLPEGLDPDEFARSHSAEDFRKYVEDHQTDFIQFKSEVLLGNETDPIKRSEAINSIVQSIAVIKNQILRDTYIHDCADRLHYNERSLIEVMNRMIRNGMNEQVKEERRVAGLRDVPVQHSQQSGKAPTPMEQVEEVEKMLVQAVIRYGERIITVQDADGKDVSLPVAQYILLDLGADNLEFHHATYNLILKEANEHLGDEGFVCEDYFLKHPDPEISRIAAEMCVDKFHLSESLKIKMNADQLRQNVFRLVLDFRMDYVEHHLSELKQQIVAANNDPEKMMPLIKEYTDMQKIRSYIAAKLGSNIII